MAKCVFGSFLFVVVLLSLLFHSTFTSHPSKILFKINTHTPQKIIIILCYVTTRLISFVERPWATMEAPTRHCSSWLDRVSECWCVGRFFFILFKLNHNENNKFVRSRSLVVCYYCFYWHHDVLFFFSSFFLQTFWFRLREHLRTITPVRSALWKIDDEKATKRKWVYSWKLCQPLAAHNNNSRRRHYRASHLRQLRTNITITVAAAHESANRFLGSEVVVGLEVKQVDITIPLPPLPRTKKIQRSTPMKVTEKKLKHARLHHRLNNSILDWLRD